MFRLCHEETGQDMVEYTLLLAFIALAAAAIYMGMTPLTSSLWGIANSRLANASN
jgi:Flp pilus assembly pilin Flp